MKEIFNPFPLLGVFASGFGSNLQVILDQTQEGKIPAKVSMVFSDHPEAYALVRAKKAGVETFSFSPSSFSSREEFDRELIHLCKKMKIQWIVLAGYMRILGQEFVRTFRGRIVNIHPSLLPKYPGTHAIERAFEAKEEFLGVTVHFVNEEVDRGPIIMQEKIPLLAEETLEQITTRVHELEHRLFPQAIREVVQGKIVYEEVGCEKKNV